ncbi:MAG TPA: glycosyltransferase family A protein [Gaiellaceae bacterium]|jgi:glycosyltransferase involved in cell wall biosynthesis
MKASFVEIATLSQTLDEFRTQAQRMIDSLQLIYDDEPGNRRRLAELREMEEYELAFTESEPMVSVVIPTYTNHEMLRERAIPSVLAQSYSNFEIVVVGDAAPPTTAEVVASFGDSRIVYENLSVRGPYPEDAFDRWNVTPVPPYNAAVRRAGGRWISPFADDDALRPHALELMVETVQRERHEVCYGKLNCILDDGSEVVFGTFPPEHSGFGLQGGVYHAGLSFIEQELGYYLFGLPNDWAMARRMLRVGARFGFVDEVVADYYPTSNPRGGFDPAWWMRQHEAPAAENVS